MSQLTERYIVLKKADVAMLAPEAQRQLSRLCNAIDFVREHRGKKPIQSVVVEHDWPEYGPTIQAILNRSSGVKTEEFHMWEELAGMAIGALAIFGFFELLFR